MTAPPSERRKESRRACQAAVVLENLDPMPSPGATMLNYSDFGLYIEANQPHPVGARLFVGMADSPYRPAGRARYECHCAIVKWRRELYSSDHLYGYGLEHRDPPCSCRRDVTVPIFEEDFICDRPEPRSEQRKHPRRRFRKPVYFKAGKNTLKGMVGNISRGGIFIITPRRFRIGGGVELVIPNTRLAKKNALRGRVVRVEDRGLGIKFTGLVKPKSNPI